MTAASPHEEGDGPLFQVPSNMQDREAQIAGWQEQTKILTAWISEQNERAGDIAALVALLRSCAAARHEARKSHLGYEPILAVQEVARRGERALLMAVEAHRRSGTLLRRGQNADPAHSLAKRSGVKQLSDYGITANTLSSMSTMFAIDGYQFSDEDFELAIARCLALGKMPRTTMEEQLTDILANRGNADRATRMRRLASVGSTSEQIAAELGIGVEHTRRLLRKQEIDVPGDRVTAGRHGRKIPADRIIGRTVELLEGTQSSLEMLSPSDISAIPDSQRAAWARSLVSSMKTLRALHKELTSVD